MRTSGILCTNNRDDRRRWRDQACWVDQPMLTKENTATETVRMTNRKARTTFVTRGTAADATTKARDTTRGTTMEFVLQSSREAREPTRSIRSFDRTTQRFRLSLRLLDAGKYKEVEVHSPMSAYALVRASQRTAILRNVCSYSSNRDRIQRQLQQHTMQRQATTSSTRRAGAASAVF